MPIAALLAGTFLFTAGPSEGRSVYTRVDDKCRQAAHHGKPARVCPGRDGWRIVVVPEGERSYLVLRKGGYEKSLRDDIFSQKMGQFPEVRAGARVEWRIDQRGKARALIVRIHAVDPDKDLQRDESPYRSRLLIVRLGDRACTLGVVDDNDQARLLADGDHSCEEQP